METEFSASDPYVGFRGWHVVDTDHGKRLVSRGTVEWPGNGEYLVAECHKRSSRKGHEIPVPSCSCGIYAGLNLEHLRDMGYVDSHVGYRGMATGVVGEVWLKGKVIECTTGYRAEMAYPKKIYVPHVFWRALKPLQQAYGCEGCEVILRNPFKKEDQ